MGILLVWIRNGNSSERLKDFNLINSIYYSKGIY